MLVEVTSVDQLIERLRKGKYRSSGEIVAKSEHLPIFRLAQSDSTCLDSETIYANGSRHHLGSSKAHVEMSGT